ncbi:histidine kinase [Fluviicola sp.]|uniref:sensor histidine kinase n=1 Tax=Fluviicola sp. TaxID=1917219 RepID=UPI0026117B99|nr:sensor histidine kinase [Fluviicola sp.]
MKFSWKVLLVHSLLILLFLSIPVISSPDFNYTADIFRVPPFLKIFVGYLLVICFFYLNYYLILPKYFFKKKYALYVLWVCGCFAVIIAFEHFLFPNPLPRPFGSENVATNHQLHRPPPFDFYPYINLIVPFLLVLLFSVSLGFNRKTKQIELDKYQAELQNLKYQLQPHFLFNSLNNIYSISILEPQKTPQYILELSEILRYLLKTDGSLTVLLSDDLRFCKQYIDLQNLRFENDSDWEIDIPEVKSNIQISPFLMMPIIENVFKYGIHPDKASPIKIQILLDRNKITLTTFNRKNNHAGENLLLTQKLGLTKTKERLNLLFPGKHRLEIQENTQDFQVTLEIELKNDQTV